MEIFEIKELLSRIGNSSTETIDRFLKDIPCKKMGKSGIKLFSYTPDIQLVESDGSRSLSLEVIIHPERQDGNPVPIFLSVDQYIRLNQPDGLQTKGLHFRGSFHLGSGRWLSVITGSGPQLAELLENFI